MTGAEFKTFEKAAKATVRRLSAENTWLRHSLMEMETRVAGLHAQLDALEKRARAMKQQLAAATPKTTPKTRSKE
jgi:predicted RNase H-like nuclease (RuvC/YqgF family)